MLDLAGVHQAVDRRDAGFDHGCPSAGAGRHIFNCDVSGETGEHDAIFDNPDIFSGHNVDVDLD